jgi:flavin-dependent dehydrogenase
VAQPIGDADRPVLAMGGLVNRLRRFVTPQGPLAVGFFVLGDAAYCTNPLYGRGCAQGFLHAHFLAEAVAASGGDLRAAAVALDQRARRVIEPFFRASVLADRDAVRRAEGRRPRRLRARWRSKFLDDGVGVAVRCDAVVFRAMMRMMNMLETPDQAFGRPRVVVRALWALLRNRRLKRRFGPPLPPERESTIARCEAAALGVVG